MKAQEIQSPVDTLLSTDCGAEVDDQWAIAHLALSPRINLLGIVSTHAPNIPAPAAETSAKLAQEVLDNMPLRRKPPVVPGSNQPLETRDMPRHNAGVEFILETARRYTPDNPLTILTIGAATDLASALLIEPSLVRCMKLISMAFHSPKQGGREFNVQNDVLAWQVLLDSPIALTIGDAATCIRYLSMSKDKAQNLFSPCGAAGTYLVGLLEWWLQTQPEIVKGVTGRHDTWPLWDEITTAHLLGLTEVVTYPRPRLLDNLDLDFTPREEHPNPVAHWIELVRADALWNDLIQCLQSAQS